MNKKVITMYMKQTTETFEAMSCFVVKESNNI